MTLFQAFEQMVKNPSPKGAPLKGAPLVAVRQVGKRRQYIGLPKCGLGEMEPLLARMAHDDEHDDWEVRREDQARP